MNDHPFSLYDFLGYLFPGFIFLLFLSVAISFFGEIWYVGGICSLSTIGDILVGVIKDSRLSQLQMTVITVVFSYVSGHIIAYLSCLTVEKFAYWEFSYPSNFLLREQTVNSNIMERWKTFWGSSVKGIKNATDNNRKSERRAFRIRYIFVFLFVLPISLFFVLGGVPLRVTHFITRKLDDKISKAVSDKIRNLRKKLDIKDADDKPEDIHRVVMHYVYHNIPGCQRKADNYIALYGFLRSMTLIACMVTDYLLILLIVSIFNEGSLDLKGIIVVLFVCPTICILLFLAFMKFYRRFTLENYMNLLTEIEVPTHSVETKRMSQDNVKSLIYISKNKM